jgi:hypothetical protein
LLVGRSVDTRVVRGDGRVVRGDGGVVRGDDRVARGDVSHGIDINLLVGRSVDTSSGMTQISRVEKYLLTLK